MKYLNRFVILAVFLILHLCAWSITIYDHNKNPSDPNIVWGRIQEFLCILDAPVLIVMIIFQNSFGLNWTNNAMCLLVGGSIQWTFFILVIPVIFRFLFPLRKNRLAKHVS